MKRYWATLATHLKSREKSQANKNMKNILKQTIENLTIIQNKLPEYERESVTTLISDLKVSYFDLEEVE